MLWAIPLALGRLFSEFQTDPTLDPFFTRVSHGGSLNLSSLIPYRTEYHTLRRKRISFTFEGTLRSVLSKRGRFFLNRSMKSVSEPGRTKSADRI